MKFRRTFVLALALLSAACSNQSDNAALTGSSAASAPNATDTLAIPATTTAATATTTTTVAADADPNSAAVDSDFFDPSLIHTIEIAFDQGAYDEMIKTFQDNSDKTWLEADVTIDGTNYRQAGIRLKGNSSLFGIGGFGPGGVPTGIDIVGPDVAAGEGGGLTGIPPECAAIFDELPRVGPAGGPRGPAGGPIGGPAGGGPGGDADADKPETLPWQIRLDKYIPDQAHQGQTDFVVRSSSSAAPLNEAVALDLLGRAGLATERASAVRFSANGGDATLRLTIEFLNDQWADETFSKGGKLYKADSTGDYSYRGTDPADYATAWEQEGGEDDLTPLIDFLEFINNSTDEDFAAELPQRLDVNAFARYLAFEDLINNFDDIAGPGNNSYLYFDGTTEQFTVVAWDHNLAFTSGFGPAGVAEGTPGGPGLPFDPANLPEGCTLPTGPGGGQGPGGNPLSGSNVLVERFNANEQFKALYDEAVTALTKELFTSGAAKQSLDTWSKTMAQADLVDEATLANLADEILASFPGS